MASYSVLESWAAVCQGLIDSVAHTARDVAALRTCDAPGVQELLAARERDAEQWAVALVGLYAKVAASGRLIGAVEMQRMLGHSIHLDRLRLFVDDEGLSRDTLLGRLFVKLATKRREARRRIALLDCHVAGTAYRSLDRVERADGTVVVTAAEDELTVGEELALERQPNNRFDSRAIRVTSSAGRWLGYVPATHNDMLARLLDGGKTLVGTVLRVRRHPREWLEIEMTVSLVDEERQWPVLPERV